MFSVSVKIMRERLPGIRFFHCRYLLRRAMRDDASAVFSTLRAEINDPIGIADHIQIVLDDDDGVSQVGQPVEHVEQLAHIVEVQAGGWLVQQVKRFAGLALAQFRGQLDALGFAAGKRDGGLAEMDVAQPNIHQRLQFLSDLRNVFQNWQRVGNRGLQQIGDGLAVELHRQCFLVVAASAADFAEHVHVRQEIHLDAALAFALAGLAASAGDIEGKTSGLVAALARLRQHGVEVADLGEDAGVSCGIGAWRAADGRLVDADDFVDILCAGDGLVRSGLFARAIKLLARARDRECH